MSKMPLKMLYQRFVDYCKEFGYRSCAHQAFSKRIQAIGYTVERKAYYGRDVGIFIPISFSSKTN
jgi:hypothetical protein